MILKLLIDLYRWLWGIKPLVVQTVDESTLFVITFAAIIDIGAIAVIITLATNAYNNRKKER